jgi:ABC-type transport system substrate-binding protein
MTNPQIDALTGMPVPRRRAVLAAFAAMLAALAAMFAAHTTVAAEPRPSRGGILTFAVDAEPPNYDCHSNFSFVLIHPVIPHYSTLLKFDTANYPQVAGDLAESWNVSPDRLTYTFKLRQNVLFHDGSRLTSADVKASYDRIIHPSQGVLSVRQADCRNHPDRYARPGDGGLSSAMARRSHAGQLRLTLELHLHCRKAQRRPSFP